MTDIEQITKAVNQGVSKEMLERWLENYAKRQFKDICTSCRGKGYSTNYHGITGAEDLDMHGWTEPMRIHVEYCFCARGTALKKVIENKQNESRMLLLRQIYRNVKAKKWDFGKQQMLTMLKGYWKSFQE